MTVRKNTGIWAAALLACLLVTGCENDILNPTQIGRFRPVPVVNVILENLGVADEPDPTYAAAEEPRPEDLISYEQDYRFGVGDVIRISIWELLREGYPFVNDYVVTETGHISIPDAGLVRAMGLSERELEKEIQDILTPGILKDPSVTVILLESQSRFFSIYGAAVSRPGRYPIPRYDYHLTDAIALAGDVGQYNVSYLFITRDTPVESAMSGSIRPAGENPASIQSKPNDLKPIGPSQQPEAPEEELIKVIQPYSDGESNSSEIEREPLTKKSGIAVRAAAMAESEPAAAPANPDNPTDWILEDGKWKPVRTSSSPSSSQPSNPIADPFLARQTTPRVIKIPVDRLKSGDPRYDIVIRPGDRISAPVDVIGEFWVMGNVNRTGPLNITGRPMTLKMAIATAGGLGELAWPKKVEVIRRIGRNKAGLMQEETVLVDLDKIAKGLQPDFFIKQYDLINVGTHGSSRFLFELRNGFRINYGFGFLYDRNFADRDFGDDPLPTSFGQIF